MTFWEDGIDPATGAVRVGCWMAETPTREATPRHWVPAGATLTRDMHNISKFVAMCGGRVVPIDGDGGYHPPCPDCQIWATS